MRNRLIFVFLVLLFAFATLLSAGAESAIVRLYSDKNDEVHVATQDGRDVTVHREQGQIGMSDPKTSDDRKTAGWLVLYKNPDPGSPVAGKLVVWRHGHIFRSFRTAQSFWSWAFEHRGDQVAYHVGPMHGETASHCELHDLRTGRMLASWDGDLESADRPAWTRKLDH